MTTNTSSGNFTFTDTNLPPPKRFIYRSDADPLIDRHRRGVSTTPPGIGPHCRTGDSPVRSGIANQIEACSLKSVPTCSRLPDRSVKHCRLKTTGAVSEHVYARTQYFPPGAVHVSALLSCTDQIQATERRRAAAALLRSFACCRLPRWRRRHPSPCNPRSARWFRDPITRFPSRRTGRRRCSFNGVAKRWIFRPDQHVPGAFQYPIRRRGALCGGGDQSQRFRDQCAGPATVRPADAPRYPTPQGGWAYLFGGDRRRMPSRVRWMAGALDGRCWPTTTRRRRAARRCSGRW